MNLNLTDPPSAVHDIVLSRYVVKVAGIEAIIISDGILTPPAESIATNADPVTRNAWLDECFLDHKAFDWALNAVVVRSGNQTILVDSGLGEEYPDFSRAGQFVSRLEAAGVDFHSVTDIVLTHTHFDDVCGLLASGVKERLGSGIRVDEPLKWYLFQHRLG
ncbi:MBL fold metallo-hydrolase [Rhizobium sp. GR12]|uniref:MBL fold metallo-hydrolase n=1 Tax=Rhizobium sp. GR12 TaxID=3053925 RepID=UPI002FBED936